MAVNLPHCSGNKGYNDPDFSRGIAVPPLAKRQQRLMNQSLGPLRQQSASSELSAALNACRRAFYAIALFSGMSNILMLSGALFMLEVYDRVLPSRSVPTLVALLLLVAGLYAAQGVIDAIRSRILVRIGH